MNERKEHWDGESYQTGSTQPPKSKGCLVAVLLALVILLGGISTALGLMNIRLFRKLQDTNAMAFHAASPSDTAQPLVGDQVPYGIRLTLGVECETVGPIYQRFYDIPGGVLMVEIEENSQAARCGILQSDILISAGGKPMSSCEEFQALWEALEGGETMELVLYRHRQGGNVIVTITGEK